MRSLLSRLALGWAALAVGLCLVLPEPVATWVAILSVAAAAFSVAVGRTRRRRVDVADPPPATVMQEAGLLETAATVVRACVHAHDLSAALHGVARALFQELGAEGLMTGQLDDAGAMCRLDRFADQASRFPAPPRESMSPMATDATTNQRITGNPSAGFAVPVLRQGRTVAWLEFTALEMKVDAVALMRLLDIVRMELSAVADRCPAPASFKPAVPCGVVPQKAGAPSTQAEPPAARARRPAPNESRPLLTRYARQRAEGEAGATDGGDVLDMDALDRLRALDPNGVNRLLERVVKAFETSATRQIPHLRDALLNDDLEAVRQVAHALRGASVSVGATRLARLCDELEDPAFDPRIESLAAHLKIMFSEIDMVLSVLRSQPVKHP